MASSNKITISDFFLSEIEMAFDDNSFMAEWYIDLQENDVVFISDDNIEELEVIQEQIEQDVDQERFVPIPNRTSREGYAQMQRFIYDLNNSHKQDVLYTAIDGRGAFRRFKDALYRVDLHEEWYEFSNRENRKEVLDWLLVEGFIDEDDVQLGMDMYEQELARQKRRKVNLTKMKKGAVVICSGNGGHTGQVTPGKTYEVLEEQQQNQNIRINDDRGKLIWIPKSHFEWVSDG